MLKYLIDLTFPIGSEKSLSLLLILLSFISCEKDHLLTQDNLTANHPKVIDGVMVFDSELQLHSFLEDLDEELSSLSPLQKEDYLVTLENSLGHHSLLFTQPDITLRSDNGTFTIEEIMATKDDDFIHDYLEKFMLNEYYEVVVNDTLYIQQARNLEFKVPFENKAAQLLARQLTKGDPSIPAAIIRSGATIEENPRIQFKPIVTNPPNPPNPPVGELCNFIGYNFSPFVTTFSPCSNTSAVSASLTRVCVDGADNRPQNGFWTVDFGDGTVETFNGDFLSEISTQGHSYDDDGNYTITITVNFIDQDGEGASFSRSFNVGLAPVTACSRENRERARFIEHPDRPFAIRTQIWRRQSILGTNVGGKTESWNLRDDAKWKVISVGEVEVSVEIPWRWKPGRNDACEIESIGADFDRENGANTTVREWSIAKRGAYIGREAITTHRLTAFGNLEITGELDLDFSCN